MLTGVQACALTGYERLFLMILRQGRKLNLGMLKGFSEVYTARPWCRMWKEVPGLSLGLPHHCTTLPPGSGL